MWLDKSAGNRPLNRKKIKQLANLMVLGKFRENGQPVIFSDTGLLFDGHHRLTAIVVAGISIKLLVTRGVSADARATIDQGMKWSVGHFMAADGEHNWTSLARAARELAHYTRNPEQLLPTGETFTTQDILDVLTKHPGLRYSLERTHGCRDLLSMGTLTWVHYIFARRFGKGRVDEMVDQFIKGDELSIGSPLLTLRKRLLREKFSRMARRSTAHPRVLTAYCIMAFNAYIEGRTLLKFGRRELNKMPRLSTKKFKDTN
jgi:hypothetical protein